MTDFLEIYGRQIAQAAGTHLYYVLLSVAIAFAVSLTLGILLSRAPRWANIILPLLSLFQTVPGIVFIGLLFLAIGIVPATIIIALAIYAIFPIL